MFGDERMIVIYVQFNTSPLPFVFLGLSEWYQIMSEMITKQNHWNLCLRTNIIIIVKDYIKQFRLTNKI